MAESLWFVAKHETMALCYYMYLYVIYCHLILVSFVSIVFYSALMCIISQHPYARDELLHPWLQHVQYDMPCKMEEHPPSCFKASENVLAPSGTVL